MTKLRNPIYEDDVIIEDAEEKLVVLENPDKEWHESWHEGRHLANFPHPFRAWICGRPNSGKGLVAKNIIGHADPVWDRVVILHCAKNSTKEWDDVVLDEDDVIETVPPLDFFYDDEETQKNLLVIDDFNLATLDKESKLRIDRILGYISTHASWSIMILHQDLLQSRVCQRRMCNIIVLYKLTDIDSCCVLARKAGVKRKHFMAILKKFKSPHDFLVIDNTTGSPMPLRVNMYHRVVIPDEEEN
jgi:hypothetical protein